MPRLVSAAAFGETNCRAHGRQMENGKSAKYPLVCSVTCWWPGMLTTCATKFAMNDLKPRTIVGGGMAGLTLGFALVALQMPVTLCDAGQYPRNRVSGEFISGRGQEILKRLGLLTHFQRAGAIFSRTAGFFLGDFKSPVP